MVSQDVTDIIIIMMVFIVGGSLQVIFMYVIDRFRQKGPAHYLGVSMMEAWAWDAGDSLRGGHVAGLPVDTKALAELARRRKEGTAQEHIKVYTDATEKEMLAQEAAELAKKKEELDAASRQVLPPG